MAARRMIPIEDAASALGVTVETLRSAAPYTLILHLPKGDGAPPSFREYVRESFVRTIVRRRVE